MTVICLWAHSRSRSTAFSRMMLERGDVTVLHEPWLALAETGAATVPQPGGGESAVDSGPELVDRLAELGQERPVFVKEVLDQRYPYVFDQPQALAAFWHTFIVRHPRPTIASHYAMKPTVTSPEIGFERLHELFELVRAASGRQPLVLRAERLVDEPEAVVRGFCDHVGLPFLPEALSWRPQDRAEWQRHRAWHLDAIGSSGLVDRGNTYADTVDNNATLRAFYAHHYPYYEKVVRHAE
ncbi:sulfotransferase family protein [Streptomyces sp. HSW2009]|uniref:sulfotransferase-like domain-containing protein n=1 Tax=Streptomyces sp. HSW2009 TaxID=3142890 RepID=UPI0032EE7D8C